MGGTVGETIRRKDGTIHKMARGTGAYNRMFFSSFWAKGEIDKAIDEHLAIFESMKKDFEVNQGTKQFEFEASPVYGWCNEMMPIEYGLVVIDFQTNKIHSCQGYDTPGRYLLGLYYVDEKEFYQSVFEKNNVIFSDWDGEVKGDVEDLFWKNVKFEDVEALFLRQSVTSPDGQVFEHNYLATHQIKQLVYKDFPFEVIYYDETPEGYLQMLRALIHDGFSFNEAEIKGWNTHIDYYLEEPSSYINVREGVNSAKAEENYVEQIKKQFQSLFETS